ncbi:MAG: transcription elongation factor GreA [Oscillospiraceae bacterium]
MIVSKEILVTHEGLAKLEAELEDLKTVKRKDCAEKIKEARSFGDLSENSEYDEAKNEQGFVESRIAELEKMLKNVRVIDGDDVQCDSIEVGCHVCVKDEDGEAEEYDIVGSTEIDALNGKISDESPIGNALLGKRIGEVADVVLPNGSTFQYTVTAISKSL